MSVMFRENNELQYGKRFPVKPKKAVYKNNVRLTILYVSGAWCLKKVICEFVKGQTNPQ